MADELSPAQHKAIEALLIAGDLKDAAQRAGVGYRTLRGWLAEDSAFSAAYADARRAATQQAIAQLQQGARAAAAVLIEIAADSAIAPAHRVNAASKILDFAMRAVELADVEQRLAELERLVSSAS